MDYIIDPMWFYWARVCNAVCTISAIFSAVLFIVAIFGVVFMIENRSYGPEDKDYKTGKTIFKVACPLAIILLLAAVFIPSKETLMEMLIARFATYSNAELTIDTIKDIVDYIMEAMKSV